VSSFGDSIEAGLVETSCAGLNTGSAGSVTTSTFAVGIAGVGIATFGGLGAGADLDALTVGGGLGALVKGSIFGTAPIRARFVLAWLLAIGDWVCCTFVPSRATPLDWPLAIGDWLRCGVVVNCTTAFVGTGRAGGFISCSRWRAMAEICSKFSGGGLNARYSRYFCSASWWSFKYWCDTIATLSKAGR